MKCSNKIYYQYLLIVFISLVFISLVACSGPKQIINDSTSSNSSSQSNSYKDSRWPTTNSELLSIPESSRWYTALNRIGKTGTIAGPVMRVNQATKSKGKPTYIDIGEAYPSSNRCQIVIWEQDRSKFAKELAICEKSGTWISVTGPISSYKGIAEINCKSSNNVSFKVWEDVS